MQVYQTIGSQESYWDRPSDSAGFLQLLQSEKLNFLQPRQPETLTLFSALIVLLHVPIAGPPLYKTRLAFDAMIFVRRRR